MGNKDNSGRRWKAARRKHLLQNVQNIARRRLAKRQIASRELDDTASHLDVNRKTWQELIARPDLARPETKSHFVCSVHFDPSVIEYKPQLQLKALPTKLLLSQPTTSNTSNETTTTECATQTSHKKAVKKSESAQTTEALTPRKRKVNKDLKDTNKTKTTENKTSK